ncbi:MAG TPA: F0F1 ATP synthase subunit epsilon [Thermodesulfovibrionales bacterium]|nr:F0F1 ATP synthase subunit epsilon [Thermodesulfovibrionales bacterium]
MSNTSFRLNIVTPTKMFERDIRYIRLKDETGFFGIMKGHIDFLTVLVPSLCYYIDTNTKEIFLAVDGGILSVRGETVSLTSKQVFESEDSEKLAEIIENTIWKREESEKTFLKMLEGIERSFMEKTIEFIRRF